LAQSYKEKYNKHFDEKEDKERYLIFLHHIQNIDSLNAEEGKNIHKPGILTTLSEAEFRAIYLSHTYGRNENIDVKLEGASRGHDLISTTALSATFVDWTDIYTTPIKNQGQCGTCSAFGAVGKKLCYVKLV